MSVKKRAVIVTILIVGLLAASVGAVLYGSLTAPPAKYAYIYQDNQVLQKIDLAKVEEPYQLRIETGAGGYNLIEVRNGSIGIVEASCPDKLCKNMGFISSSLLPITCLPNHLVIVVEGENTDLDGIVY